MIFLYWQVSFWLIRTMIRKVPGILVNCYKRLKFSGLSVLATEAPNKSYCESIETR